MTSKRGFPLLLVVLFSVAGCATTTSSSIPTNANDVYLAPVKNRSNEIGLSSIITDQATQQLLADGRVDLVDRRKADVVVRSVVTDYQRIPLIYNEQDIVQQYKVRVEMALRLEDADTGEVLNQFDNIFRETTYSDINPPIETEQVAKERVVRKLARDIVTTVVEGWPYLKL